MYDHIHHLYSSSWSENNSSKNKNQGMGKLLASLYTLFRPFPILRFNSILRLFLSLLLSFFSEQYQDLGSEHFLTLKQAPLRKCIYSDLLVSVEFTYYFY